jgi:hypothetical protein
MSKRIPFVKDIQVESPGGEPYFKIPGSDRVTTMETIVVQVGNQMVEQKLPAWIIRQKVFLFERIADGKFTEGKDDAVEADLFRADVRGVVARQETEAIARGYWEVEDDLWVRFLAATMKPATPYNPAVSISHVPFIRAVRDAATVTAQEIDLPAMNGSSVAAQA